MSKEISALIEEIENWNDQDKARFNDGAVDFDGTFVFASRKKKIQQLRTLINLKPAKCHPTRSEPCPTCGWDGSYQTDD
jgi:sugar lactone lactonase YvrE